MIQHQYITAGDLYDGWRDDLLTGSPLVLWRAGNGALEKLELGPGLARVS